MKNYRRPYLPTREAPQILASQDGTTLLWRWIGVFTFLLIATGLVAACRVPVGRLIEPMLLATIPAQDPAATSSLLPSPTAVPAATPTPPSTQVMRGEMLFAQHCQACHRQDGGIGPSLKPRAISYYQSAERFHRYVSQTMPYGAGGSLQPQVYWDIVAYLLVSNELMPADVILGPENAATILLEVE